MSPVNKLFFTTAFFLSGALVACGQGPSESRVCYGDQCVKVKVADEDHERRTGLQDVKELADDEGMLFVFSQSAPYAFWMKDTFIALDIVWINYKQEIVHIEENVPPCREDPCPNYAPEGPALYVLEVNAGKAKEMDLRQGTRLNFKLSTSQ